MNAIEVFRKENQEFACVFFKEKAYAAFLTKPIGIANSPTLKLIQFIFEEYKDLSFFILRQRILTSVAKNELDAGLIKVTAKRIQFSTSSEDSLLQSQLNEGRELIIVGENQERIQSQYSKPLLSKGIGQKISSAQEGFVFLANIIAENRPHDLNKRDLHDRNREVGALLLDSENQILAYAINSGAINKTLHAELNLVQDYVAKNQSPLPAGCILLVTHKPCKMCAGMIFDAAAESKNLKVYYQVEESGGQSAATVLDRYGLNQKV